MRITIVNPNAVGASAKYRAQSQIKGKMTIRASFRYSYPDQWQWRPEMFAWRALKPADLAAALKAMKQKIDKNSRYVQAHKLATPVPPAEVKTPQT